MPDFLKDYEPVEDRLRAFWSEHPGGRIMTELVSFADGVYIVKAEAWTDDFKPTATGYAQEHEDRLPPNMKDSALEVCETSAIGRALANLGYAAKGKRPSREEMSKTSAPARREHTAGEKPGDRGSGADPEGAGVKHTAKADTAPAPSTYPVEPLRCAANAHQDNRGHTKWNRETDGRLVCGLCGTPKLVAMESTTEDLGPA